MELSSTGLPPSSISLPLASTPTSLLQSKIPTPRPVPTLFVHPTAHVPTAPPTVNPAPPAAGARARRPRSRYTKYRSKEASNRKGQRITSTLEHPFAMCFNRSLACGLDWGFPLRNGDNYHLVSPPASNSSLLTEEIGEDSETQSHDLPHGVKARGICRSSCTQYIVILPLRWPR